MDQVHVRSVAQFTVELASNEQTRDRYYKAQTSQEKGMKEESKKKDEGKSSA